MIERKVISMSKAEVYYMLHCKYKRSHYLYSVFSLIPVLRRKYVFDSTCIYLFSPPDCLSSHVKLYNNQSGTCTYTYSIRKHKITYMRGESQKIAAEQHGFSSAYSKEILPDSGNLATAIKNHSWFFVRHYSPTNDFISSIVNYCRQTHYG